MVENGIISTMGLNIKNPEVERLAAEVAAALGVTKTEAIRQALEDRAKVLGIADRRKGLEDFHRTLEKLWAENPEIRNIKITKEDYDAIFE